VSVDLRTISADEARQLGITSAVGYDPDASAPGALLRADRPPTIPQAWIPFRGRWLAPRGFEIKGGDPPQILLPDNPNRYGALLFNAGGQIELPIPMPMGTLGGLALAQFLDSGSVQVPTYAGSSYKAIYIVIDAQLTKGAGSQATAQLLVGRQPWPPASGGATQVGVGNNLSMTTLKGAAFNLGGVAATLGPGAFPISPADIGDLQWPHPYIGVELNAGGALTGGAARVLLEMPGGPMVVVGEDSNINPALTGARANGFPIPSGGSPVLWQGTGELWVAATPGGYADFRVVEIVMAPPQEAPAA
jgi:hypothetical protein